MDLSISRRDKDRDKAKKQLKELKHVKSMPIRSNKPSYRGGQHVPKDKIVYPLIPTAHHVDILESRPSTSSYSTYDTYNSEPTLDLLPPPRPEVTKFAEDLRKERQIESMRARNKPLPPSPRKLHQPHYFTTHGYRSPAAAQATPTKPRATAKPSTVASAKEVPKPVPGVALRAKNSHLREIPTVPSPSTNQRKVDYTKLGPPTAQFNPFRPIRPQLEATMSTPQLRQERAISPSPKPAPKAQVPQSVRPQVFSTTDSDSDSVYSDEFSMDSVSVLSNESPRRHPFVRYRDAHTHTGESHKTASPSPSSADEFGVRRDHDEERSLATSASSLQRWPVVKRTPSSGSIVYQSESVGGKSTYAQDMLHRANKAAAVASLRAAPSTPESSHTKAKVALSPQPPSRYIRDPAPAHFKSRPLEAGIPFPSGTLPPNGKPASPSTHTSSPKAAPNARQGTQRTQYYDPMYFSGKHQQQPGFQPTRGNRIAQLPTTGVPAGPSVMHSTPPPMTRSHSPKLRNVPFPVPQASIRPLNPHKHSRPHHPTGDLHPPALQQSLAKQSVKVTAAATTGVAKRKSCKAEVVAVNGMLSREQLDLALYEPECVVPVPKVDVKHRNRAAQVQGQSTRAEARK